MIESRKEIKNERLGETALRLIHDSGLVILISKKSVFKSSYALFGTKFGSVCTGFECGGKKTTVPDGTAHFLEHKLFDNEDGDAFSLFSGTGALANAYTSYEQTCYLFSCTDHFEDNLEILLDFVSRPYFTPQSIAKEQGIIGQEIKMYNDNYGWVSYRNVLGCLYKNHPLNRDIAGSVESIATIDDKVLYDCYNTFYNPANMILSVAGNVDEKKIIALVDKYIKKKDTGVFAVTQCDEPDEIVSDRCEITGEVEIPVFVLGYKEPSGQRSIKEKCMANVALEAVFGESSDFYGNLYKEGLINSSFGYEICNVACANCILFSGEVANPEEVIRRIRIRCDEMHEKGFEKSDFDGVLRKFYGNMVIGTDSVTAQAEAAFSAELDGVSPYDKINILSVITYGETLEYSKKLLDNNRSAVSLVMPV